MSEAKIKTHFNSNLLSSMSIFLKQACIMRVIDNLILNGKTHSNRHKI